MSSTGEPRRDVAIVVPTFNPDEGFAGRLRGLREQAGTVVVADDGSTADLGAVVAAVEETGCVLIRSPLNRGIAAALNTGVRRAMESDAVAFVLTVDQDSSLEADYVAEAVAVLTAAREGAARVAGVVAGRFDGSRGRGSSGEAEPTSTGWELLQSGLVARVEALRDVGLFDETLFIDCVDTEWGLRAHRRGWRFLIAPGCVMTHGAGVELERTVPLVGTVRFSVHSPLRRFYIARNRAFITAGYAASAPGWAVRQLRSQVVIALWGVVFGPRRLGQLTGSLLGLGCAAVGRRGPAPAGVARLLSRLGTGRRR